ncbi:MAG TPA: GFA family protein [Burkholderiaceae bacterium]|nr:GFA family protein [Burkholderiaceae bacterium]
MHRGSCLCGKVRYEVDGELTDVSHCHCTMCRKAHGAAYGSYGNVRREQFRFVAGESGVARYRSSAGVLRTFCAECGATLQWLRVDPQSPWVSFTLGTLDTRYAPEPDARPRHIFVGSRADWVEVAPHWDVRE